MLWRFGPPLLGLPVASVMEVGRLGIERTTSVGGAEIDRDRVGSDVGSEAPGRSQGRRTGVGLLSVLVWLVAESGTGRGGHGAKAGPVRWIESDPSMVHEWEEPGETCHVTWPAGGG